MEGTILLQVAAIPVLGVSSMWIAWRMGLPSILILLLAGILVGPVFGVLHPEELLGHILFPIISISVAIILFEGGLSLKIQDLRKTGKSVRNLVTIGNLITWVTISAASFYILNLSLEVSILLGSILVVTGPTVIIPLLSHVGPKKRLSSILRWEGIVIDPIGAIQAVFVLEVILAASIGDAVGTVLSIFLKTLIIGTVMGFLGAANIIVFIKKHWMPDFLQESFTLIVVLGIYTLSNYFQTESGLLSVTIMGIILANQRVVTIKHIVTFKENLTIILLSTVFIILAANLQLADLMNHLNMQSMLFLAVVIFVARPLSVFASTWGSPLSINGKLFLSWMAPRGIVAAAVASLFALRLEALGIEHASSLVSITFLVIISTVMIYGLTAQPVAKLLGVLKPKKHGILMVGAHPWARTLAKVLQKNHIHVLLVDTNKNHYFEAREEGLNCIHGSILSKKVSDEIELGNIGQLVSLTPSDEVNLLSTIEYEPLFGRKHVFRLFPSSKEPSERTKHTLETLLFGNGITYTYLSARLTAGAEFRAVKINDQYSYKTFLQHNPKMLPLFIVTQKHHIVSISADKKHSPRTGQTLIYLGKPALS